MVTIANSRAAPFNEMNIFPTRRDEAGRSSRRDEDKRNSTQVRL
jgi:hypothetical protein